MILGVLHLGKEAFFDGLRTRLRELGAAETDIERYIRQFERYFNTMTDEEAEEQIGGLDGTEGVAQNIMKLIRKRTAAVSDENAAEEAPSYELPFAEHGDTMIFHAVGGAADEEEPDSGSTMTFETVPVATTAADDGSAGEKTQPSAEFVEKTKRAEFPAGDKTAETVKKTAVKNRNTRKKSRQRLSTEPEGDLSPRPVDLSPSLTAETEVSEKTEVSQSEMPEETVLSERPDAVGEMPFSAEGQNSNSTGFSYSPDEDGIEDFENDFLDRGEPEKGIVSLIAGASRLFSRVGTKTDAPLSKAAGKSVRTLPQEPVGIQGDTAASEVPAPREKNMQRKAGADEAYSRRTDEDFGGERDQKMHAAISERETVSARTASQDLPLVSDARAALLERDASQELTVADMASEDGYYTPEPVNYEALAEECPVREKIPGTTQFWVIFALTLPITLTLFATICALFGAAFAVLAVMIVALVAVLVGIVAGGTALSLFGIIYGITQTFKVMSVGLFEIGLGVTIGGSAMLCGIIVYNVAVRFLPFVMSYLAVFFKYVMRKLRELFHYCKKECAKI